MVTKSKKARKVSSIKSTHKIEYVEVKRKSRAGVEYSSYKPVKVSI